MSGLIFENRRINSCLTLGPQIGCQQQNGALGPFASRRPEGSQPLCVVSGFGSVFKRRRPGFGRVEPLQFDPALAPASPLLGAAGVVAAPAHLARPTGARWPKLPGGTGGGGESKERRRARVGCVAQPPVWRGPPWCCSSGALDPRRGRHAGRSGCRGARGATG